MSKIAFIFPGQGAQATGMGMDLIEQSDSAKQLINLANDKLDFDLMDLLSNPEAPINETSYTQPALLAVSIALYNAFVATTDIKASMLAGLSLGEYSAHVAAGSISFEDAISLVRKRGLLMEEAGSQTKGGMAAVVKGDKDTIRDYCLNDPGVVVVANYNSPVQVVISGEDEAVKRVSARLSEDGTRVIPLTVSGAFHSPLMESAAYTFKEVLSKTSFHEPLVPIVTNVTAEEVKSASEIPELLVKQLKGSVLWEDSINNMMAEGVDTFIEIGPGKTLAGLIKKINRKVKVYNVNSFESIEKVASSLKEEV